MRIARNNLARHASHKKGSTKKFQATQTTLKSQQQRASNVLVWEHRLLYVPALQSHKACDHVQRRSSHTETLAQKNGIGVRMMAAIFE